MVEFNWDYSGYSDILHIHQKNSLTKGSAELGDFTLDFDKNDEIIGIEIEHASEFFNNLDINKQNLKAIQEAHIIIDKRNPGCQIMFLELKFPEATKKISLPLPIAG